jgi:hypothetical protein
VEQVFAGAGIADFEVEAEDHEHAIESAEDWWTIVMGSSLRGRIDQLTAQERERVRKACLGLSARALRMPVLYTVARR